jgi:hypothetical protein
LEPFQAGSCDLLPLLHHSLIDSWFPSTIKYPRLSPDFPCHTNGIDCFSKESWLLSGVGRNLETWDLSMKSANYYWGVYAPWFSLWREYTHKHTPIHTYMPTLNLLWPKADQWLPGDGAADRSRREKLQRQRLQEKCWANGGIHVSILIKVYFQIQADHLYKLCLNKARKKEPFTIWVE